MTEVLLRNAEYIPRPISRKEIKMRGIPLVTGLRPNALTDKNRYPEGKFLVEIKALRDFDWESKGIFVRLSCHPYQFETDVVEERRDSAYSFRQAFCFPIHNYFECLNFDVLVKRQIRLKALRHKRR